MGRYNKHVKFRRDTGLLTPRKYHRYARRPVCVVCAGCGDETKKIRTHLLQIRSGEIRGESGGEVVASGPVRLCPPCYNKQLKREGYRLKDIEVRRGDDFEPREVFEHPVTGVRRTPALESNR